MHGCIENGVVVPCIGWSVPDEVVLVRRNSFDTKSFKQFLRLNFKFDCSDIFPSLALPSAFSDTDHSDEMFSIVQPPPPRAKQAAVPPIFRNFVNRRIYAGIRT